MSETVDIPLDAIDVVERLRDVSVAEAERIGASMLEIGQITPIAVTGPQNGRYRLVAGAHRVEGARRVGIERLRAVVLDGSPDELRLREIDENLYRHELSAYDQAQFLDERRLVWERLYGPLKRGGDRRSKGQDVPLAEAMRRSGFVKATAQQFNLHPKAIKRALSRKAAIDPEVWSAIRGLSGAANAALLDRLRRLEYFDQQEVITRVKSRGQTLEHAVGQVWHERRRPPVEPTPNLTAVEKAWNRADEVEKQQIIAFVEEQKRILKKGGGK